MEGNNSDNKVLKKYAQEVQSEKLPTPYFGHTVNLISKTSIVIFGGAISTPDNQASYTMTSDLYLYNMAQNFWKKLETSNSYKPPHVLAVHASATVRENQVLYMLIKVEDKKNRLKNIFQKSKKNTNLNTINKSLNKNANNINIVNIKHDYFAHSNTINNENSKKSKHKTYNFLSKVYLNFDQRSRDGHNKGNKIKKNQKFLSFHKNGFKDNMSSKIVKSIDIEDNKNRAPKFNHEIIRIFPVDYKSNFFNFNSNSKNTINRVIKNLSLKRTKI